MKLTECNDCIHVTHRNTHLFCTKHDNYCENINICLFQETSLPCDWCNGSTGPEGYSCDACQLVMCSQNCLDHHVANNHCDVTFTKVTKVISQVEGNYWTPKRKEE